jgi:hypothetical protein
LDEAFTMECTIEEAWAWAGSQNVGWDTNERSKRVPIDTMSRDLEYGVLIPQSPETYEDCRTFVHWARGNMAALPG